MLKIRGCLNVDSLWNFVNNCLCAQPKVEYCLRLFISKSSNYIQSCAQFVVDGCNHAKRSSTI